MNEAALVSEKPDRRQAFRAYMRAFNPTAPPIEVIKAGLVLEDLHQSLHRNLAARADLEPGSQQLIVGGIGSGKTTELLLASQLLGVSGKTLPLYIDVSAETDLSALNSGALIASFGLRLATNLLKRDLSTVAGIEISDLQSKFEAIRDFAYGKTELHWVHYSDEDDFEWEPVEEPEGHYVQRHVEGRLKKPFPALQREIQEIREALDKFLTVLKELDLEVVVLFDGLDRLIKPDKFWAVVDQDLRALRKLSISVLATGPISVLYGAGRPIADYFDRVHHLAVIATEAEQLTFLHSLLRKRGSDTLLDSDLALGICYASGGVLRDLITLARDAGEEAFVSGHEMIHNENVEKAVRQLGVAYRRGLGKEQIKILKSLISKGSFDPSSDLGVELLVTRRVLEYSATDFRVHPALAPMLQDEAE